MRTETKECPGCAVEVDADADTCPICKYDFPRSSRWLQLTAWLMLILVILWLVF